MLIKIDEADRIFSQYIRLRDMRCMRCHSPVRLNDKGLPVSHTNSHYFGRGRMNTREDPDNCDTLCMGCHKIWASEEKEEYRNFKIHQLGQAGFDALVLRANAYKKKDRKLSLIYAKSLLSDIQKKRAVEPYDSFQ